MDIDLKLKENKEEKKELTLKQEEFCKWYVSEEFFGNGVQSYLEVYGLEDESGHKISYETAKAAASRMLTFDNVMVRINELLEIGGFNEQNVDKQHLFLINQHADLKTKMAAIKEFNRLRERGAEVHKVDVYEKYKDK